MLEDATSLVADHNKIYLEKLRSINPPCVPFFGQYQTIIFFLEEGNPDFLHNSNLINFSKRRKVAEIISEIQQYQNQAYCFQEYPKLKQFLETLDPFPILQRNEITDYLWAKSIEIEPRSSDTIKRKNAERRWPGLSLKSPGVKPKNPPHQLPKIPNPRPSKDESPLSSPNFFGSPSVTKQSPVSTPVTPSFQASPRGDDVLLPRDDPIKIPVMLPSGPVASTNTTAGGGGNSTSTFSSQQPAAVGKPPPLPPKPRVSGPPLPPRESSSPPPVPPRLPPSRPASYSGIKPPLESRPPCIEPVFPRRSVDNSAASLPPIVPRTRNGEPSPRWTTDGQTPPPNSSTSPHIRGLSAPPLPPERTGGSAPGSATWRHGGGASFSNGPASSTPVSGGGVAGTGGEMGSHFTFGHHLIHQHHSANDTSGDYHYVTFFLILLFVS